MVFDGSGRWVCAKRLEGSRFAWPQSGESEIDILALTAVFSGFELKARRHWYGRPLPGARARLLEVLIYIAGAHSGHDGQLFR